MNNFKVIKTEGDWSKEEFELFLSDHFKPASGYDYVGFEDTWDGSSEFDANIYQEEDGTYVCSIYRVHKVNGFFSTDTSCTVASCTLEIERF